MNRNGDRAMELLSALPLDTGSRWGDVAEPWQIEDARAVLCGEQPFHFITRSRGSSKTIDLSGIALASTLCMPSQNRIYWAAANRDQARLAIDAAAGFAGRTGSALAAVDVQVNRVVNRQTGTIFEAVAADAPGTWGWLPDLLLIDEFCNWPDTVSARRFWEAISSSAAKREGCRMVVLSSPSSPSHFSYKVLEHARESPLWRTSERRGPAPWMSEERLEEQRQRLPDAIFRQLFLGEWVEGEGRFLDPAIVDAAFRLPGPALEAEPGRTGFSGGLDLGHVRDRSAFAICHRQAGEIRLDRLAVWTPAKDAPVDLGEVERFVLAARRRFPGLRIKADPWQAIALCQRLREAGVTISEYHFGPRSKQQLASALLEALNSGELALYPDEELREELIGLRLRQSSTGAWSFDHAPGQHDDRAVALALALVETLEDRSGDAISISTVADPGPPVIEGRGLTRTGDRYLDRGPDGELHPPPGWKTAGLHLPR
jgi:hypothetical protein